MSGSWLPGSSFWSRLTGANLSRKPRSIPVRASVQSLPVPNSPVLCGPSSTSYHPVRLHAVWYGYTNGYTVAPSMTDRWRGLTRLSETSTTASEEEVGDGQVASTGCQESSERWSTCSRRRLPVTDRAPQVLHLHGWAVEVDWQGRVDGAQFCDLRDRSLADAGRDLVVPTAPLDGRKTQGTVVAVEGNAFTVLVEDPHLVPAQRPVVLREKCPVVVLLG